MPSDFSTEPTVFPESEDLAGVELRSCQLLFGAGHRLSATANAERQGEGWVVRLTSSPPVPTDWSPVGAGPAPTLKVAPVSHFATPSGLKKLREISSCELSERSED